MNKYENEYERNERPSLWNYLWKLMKNSDGLQ